MKELEVNLSRDAMGPEVLSALQLRAGNDPLLPRLWSFGCEGATESFIPFIPLFLSHQIININIGFSGNSPIVMVASTIARFWTWFPNIQRTRLTRLPESPVITEAASEMVLASNRDTLLSLFVNSPLTEEAQEVLYKLPNLRHLWAVLRATPPPQVTLSNLTTISVIFNHESGWSQLFHGAKLRKLESVRLVPSPSAQIGGSLEEFESAAASVQNTLSEFRFRTAQSWSPNYPSILAFKRLKVLEIDFSCHNGCSSRVKDDIVISIAKAMPRLEILRLGQATCSNPIGATFKSFVALAHCCPQLSRLRIHLQLIPLAETLDGIEQPFSSKPKCAASIPRTDCALTELQVGEASIPPGAPLAIALALVRLFPRLRNIDYANPQWKFVAETITLSKVTGDLIHYTSKMRFPYIPDRPY